jgi:2-oxo-4-hydroxy-4-carboxy-5-ureidoimidazoline decarboxylase
VTSIASPGPAWFNVASTAKASGQLNHLCSSRAWVAAVLAGRPYGSLDALLAASDAAMAALTDDDLAEAMAGHPPIGRPKSGDARSAREQSGVREALREELLELNMAYQDTHGHVFLICATGRTGDEILAAIQERIGHDTDTEREIVRTELGKINRLRLTRMVEEGHS